MRKALVIIECIILALGVILSAQGTLKAASLSGKYVPYFLFAVLGIAFIVILIRLIKKRLTYLLGIGFIVFYLFFAGFGYIVCEMNAARIKRLNYYEDKNVWLEIDGESYAWTREAFYSSEDLKPLDVSGNEAFFVVGGDKKRVSFVYVMPGEDDTVYYEIYGGATGDYLIMKKISSEIHTG